MTEGPSKLAGDDAPGPRLRVDDRVFPLETGETVLDAMLRVGLPVESSCRAGQCCACMVRGAPAPPGSQAGLKDTLVEQGYFLACQARPTGEVVLAATAPPAAETRVADRTLLGDDVLRLRLVPDSAFDFRPGQFVNVHAPGGRVRSYSIASLEAEGFLELHVRRVPGGAVSGWLHDVVAPGDPLRVAGPHGACYYTAGREGEPLILAGVGTGLAPLWGIVRDARARGHEGAVHLIQGARSPERLYLVEELRALARDWSPLEVHFCALEGEAEGVDREAIDARAVRIARELAANGRGPVRAFLCGDPPIVHALRRGLFLAGLASQDIFADPFLPSAGP